jgi:hypothetical protein
MEPAAGLPATRARAVVLAIAVLLMDGVVQVPPTVDQLAKLLLALVVYLELEHRLELALGRHRLDRRVVVVVPQQFLPTHLAEGQLAIHARAVALEIAAL